MICAISAFAQGAADDGYFPVAYSGLTQEGSILDFSYLLDAPAGKYGFVKNTDGGIGFEKSGERRFKFFGGNICFFENFPDHDTSKKAAAELARRGYNIVRFHHFDGHLADMKSAGGTGLNAENMDRLDYLFHCLKERGIYLTIDLYCSRRLADDVDKCGLNFNAKNSTQVKGYMLFTDAGFENWKSFSQNLLTHVNPYTKLAWKDDPALLTVCLINEGTITEYASAKSAFAPLINEKFSAWAAEKGVELTPENEKFYKDGFFIEHYGRAYKKMSKFVKGLGLRALLTDQNFLGGRALEIMNGNCEIVDAHTYYGHPEWIEKSWRLPARMKRGSALAEKGGSDIVMGVRRIHGKPFSISEWCHVSNNEHCAEGQFLMGAYGGMQDWDVLCRFAYTHSPLDAEPRALHFFDTQFHPALSLSERATALFLLRGDVKKSELTIPILVPKNFFKKYSAPKKYLMRQSSELAKTCALVGAPQIFLAPKPQEIGLPDGARFAIGGKEWWNVNVGVPVFYENDRTRLGHISEILEGLIDEEKGLYKSSTGEMLLDSKNETWALSAEKSEAFIGPVGARLAGKFASIENEKGWSCTLVSSADADKPLAAAKRILILHISGIKNTDVSYSGKNNNLLDNFGKLPLLASEARSYLKINADLRGWKLYALNLEGARFKEVPFTAGEDAAEISLSTRLDGACIFAYELVCEK